MSIEKHNYAAAALNPKLVETFHNMHDCHKPGNKGVCLRPSARSSEQGKNGS